MKSMYAIGERVTTKDKRAEALYRELNSKGSLVCSLGMNLSVGEEVEEGSDDESLPD